MEKIQARNGSEMKPELVISPEMIAAGARAVRVAGIGLLDAEDWEVQQVALEVYRAMQVALFSEPKSPE